MIAIEFQHVSKQFKNAKTNAINRIDLSIQEGEFITIVGSSGSGKTTLLKMINRLYEADEGKVLLFGEDINKMNLVELRRRIGYVIQQVGLFPHMSVFENVAVLPKLLKWDKGKIEQTVDRLLDLVGLDQNEFKDRFPAQLSGGQQQRVGVARALAGDPKIMLLDEPFGAIDAITRSMLQDEILRIHGGLNKTFIFITHDINEALKLGTRVVIMNEGKIVQVDTPMNIVQHPADEFVTSLLQSAMKQQAFWKFLQ